MEEIELNLESVDEGDDPLEETNYEISKMCPLLHNNKELIEFLQSRGVLKRSMRCSNKNCRREMNMHQRNSISDGWDWVCNGCHR